MDRTVTVVVDTALCTGCGLCVDICPSQTLSMQDEKAVVTGNRSLNCGHCMAVCPTEAIHVRAIDKTTVDFKTLNIDGRWLAHGDTDTPRLVKLMLSRRSCRKYKETPVERTILEDLVRIGITAPSGTNSQKWTFTLVEKREAVVCLAEGIGSFFKKLNRTAEKKYVRWLLKLAGRSELDYYYKDYYESVKQGLEEWEKKGKDILFHGAVALIIVGSRPGGSCPKEDALLATQNILLAAHALGLGTCLIGFAVSAMEKDDSIKKIAGIPIEEAVHAVIALGYPDETYERISGRKKVIIRYF